MTAAPPHLPGYRIGPELGHGSSATVWAATRARDGLSCAVKVVRPAQMDEALAEAGVLERVREPHLVTLHDVLVLGAGQVALVLQRVRGGSLERTVRQRHRLSPAEVSTVLVPLAETLDRLHARGLVHGDISPGNVLLDDDGRPVLADLGMARVLGPAAAAARATPGFIPPEVLDGEEPTAASDVYGLGALAWFALVGEAPAVPMLRPALAELVPDEDAGVVELVESAVSVEGSRRPGMLSLARRLYELAPPAPVSLVPGVDPSSALTVRLRDAARVGSVGGPEDRPRRGPWARRWSRARRLLSRYAVAGLVTAGGGLVVLGATGWVEPGEEHHAGSATKRTPDAVAAASGKPVPTGEPARTAASSQVPGPPHVPVPTPAPSPSRAAVPSSPPRPDGPVLLDRDAPARRPAELLTTLLARRAGAWNAGARANLTLSQGPSSAALAEDDTALARASRAGVAFSGVRFIAEEVRTEGAGLLRARIGRAACTARTAQGLRPVAAEPLRETQVRLVWTAQGWRLAAWSS